MPTPYNKVLKKFAREHRNASTKSEVRLWCEALSNKKLLGYSFLRQRIIDNYIADFYCKELNLVIELDGITHNQIETIIKDEEKEKYFLSLGIVTLRFNDNEVMSDINNVIRTLEIWIEHKSNLSLIPLPPSKGGQRTPIQNDK